MAKARKKQTSDAPRANGSAFNGLVSEDARDGNDALCFTPGFPGASFGAGTIHAYLAADRKPPRVVAGISLGAVSTAVMQRAYADLESAKKVPRKNSNVEAARWKFFRKYLSFMTNRPFQVIWNGIPDPSDFFAELPPIRDPVPETITDADLRRRWRDDELESRKELYLLVKLGHWLSKMPVRVSAIANTVVSFVRAKEKYPSPYIFRLLQYVMWQVSIVISLVLHIVRVPARFPDYKFRKHRENPKVLKVLLHLDSLAGWVLQRPLFGWPVYVISALVLALLQLFTANVAVVFLRSMESGPSWAIPFSIFGAAVSLFFATALGTWWIPMKGKFPFRAVPMACSVGSVSLIALGLYAGWFERFLAEGVDRFKSVRNLRDAFNAFSSYLSDRRRLTWALDNPKVFVLCVVVVAAAAMSFFLVKRLRHWLIKSFLKKVAMEKHLVHDYHLRRALTSLFGENDDSPPLTNTPFPIVLVATPLQTIEAEPTLNCQLWAKAAAGPKLVNVLRAALAVPGVFDPYPAKAPEHKERNGKEWYRNVENLERLDLVDGAVVRHNPLPAFFSFIRGDHADKVKKGMESDAMAARLESRGPAEARVHVVYNVPAQAPGPGQAQQKLDNIVDVAFLSLRLAQRRDINLEIEQTNFIARLAREIRDVLALNPARAARKQAPLEPIFPIFADHIAPPSDLSFSNPIAPKENEVLQHAAAGCKATLQQLYATQIREIHDSQGGVRCHDFLRALRKQKDPGFEGRAGLQEICQHCDQCLEPASDAGKKAVFNEEEVNSWKQRKDLEKEFPQLTSQEPRIVFVASGGVFRGPFHAGMINAMLALKIKPDLIVGASVGTLIGAALAATLAAKDREASLKILGELVEVFQNADERIAFTKTLKNAARELGIRSKMVDLAPFELRKKILEGTKSDPGFAVTGTPPILIDAISDMLLIPHRATSRIAAQFVAGHFTEAMRLLVAGIRRETLRRLDIVDAVMGASLLEPTARSLLGSTLSDNGTPWYDLTSRQPYQKWGIAIFGTSTSLYHEQPVLLGRYKYQTPSYDFVNACLASSAFPAVFAPRKEEQIFPGLGEPEIYSDGGMFDNLPISPALEILTASQRSWVASNGRNPVRELARRIENPDLFITGSLDITPSRKEKEFDNLLSIRTRAGTLQNNLKIQAFEEVSERVSAHFQFLHTLMQTRPVTDSGYLNGLVNAVLLPVYPTDKDHLNGTFQFCNALGRKLKVINQSMADGCFQTLRELAISFGQAATSGRAKAVQNLARKQRLPFLVPLPRGPVTHRPPNEHGYYCAFFAKQENGKAVPFVCPFSESGRSFAVFQSCRKDGKHKRIARKELVQIIPLPGQSAAARQAGQTQA